MTIIPCEHDMTIKLISWGVRGGASPPRGDLMMVFYLSRTGMPITIPRPQSNKESGTIKAIVFFAMALVQSATGFEPDACSSDYSGPSPSDGDVIHVGKLTGFSS